jgi:hypothetical protein
MNPNKPQYPGDYFRAVDILAPANKATRHTIARLLGFEPTSPDESRLMIPGGGTDSDEAILVDLPSDKLVSESGPADLAEPPLRQSDEAVPFKLERLSRQRSKKPDWLRAELLPDKPDSAQEKGAFEPEPLFRPELTRSILTALLATMANQGEIDLDIIIDTIAGGRVLSSVPRMSVPTLARGVQLLEDRGEAMMPFRADIQAIQKEVGLLLGGNSIDVLRFAGCPTRGAGKGSVRSWRDYFDWYRPATGTLVVCVTDLGIGKPPEPSMRAAPSEWLEFAERIRQIGCYMVALVPYGPSRWPPKLVRRISIIHWDQTTNASRIGRTLHRKREARV